MPTTRAAPRRRGVGRLAGVVVLVVVVGAGLLTWSIAAGSDARGDHRLLGLAAALAASGLAAIVLGVLGRRAWWPLLVALVLAGAAGPLTVGADLPADAVVAERTWSPRSGAELQARYVVGVGAGTLDLSALPAGELAGRRVQLQIGTGDLRVRLPAGVVTRVTGHVGVGEVRDVDASGTTRTRPGPTQTDVEIGAGDAHLDLDASVGIGDLIVEQGAPR